MVFHGKPVYILFQISIKKMNRSSFLAHAKKNQSKIEHSVHKPFCDQINVIVMN